MDFIFKSKICHKFCHKAYMSCHKAYVRWLTVTALLACIQIMKIILFSPELTPHLETI